MAPYKPVGKTIERLVAGERHRPEVAGGQFNGFRCVLSMFVALKVGVAC